jgi:hypothetical protein
MNDLIAVEKIARWQNWFQQAPRPWLPPRLPGPRGGYTCCRTHDGASSGPQTLECLEPQSRSGITGGARLVR